MLAEGKTVTFGAGYMTHERLVIERPGRSISLWENLAGASLKNEYIRILKKDGKTFRALPLESVGSADTIVQLIQNHAGSATPHG